MYGDYLAMAGSTDDSSLAAYTFISYVPFVAMMTLSTSEVFYWAKTFSLKDGCEITGIAFSTDGVLLIAHGVGLTGFITVFNA